jgi:hypothetical protein
MSLKGLLRGYAACNSARQIACTWRSSVPQQPPTTVIRGRRGMRAAQYRKRFGAMRRALRGNAAV